ncbi:cholinesterase-like [Haliotis rubra]|uniref:cholinesterase-like n=1 Tax=Haliotis rubra TaxID=36100 RepID=UPI001EE5A893|nr:cholinesterase-like [Haliotis rubra]
MRDITGVTASVCTPQCSVHSTTVESGIRMRTGKRLAFATLVTLLLELHIAKTQKVSTQDGPVLGQRLSVLGKSIDVFYGIPYAKPPVGDLRFKYPQRSESWGPEVRDAQKPTPSCFQIKDALDTDETHKQIPEDYSEDCLHLTVWAPSDNGGNLAVMVWIYGGGFVSGSTRMPLYEGKYLAAENDVIVVSMNYRLGPLGFRLPRARHHPWQHGLDGPTTGLTVGERQCCQLWWRSIPSHHIWRKCWRRQRESPPGVTTVT